MFGREPAVNIHQEVRRQWEAADQAVPRFSLESMRTGILPASKNVYVNTGVWGLAGMNEYVLDVASCSIEDIEAYLRGLEQKQILNFRELLERRPTGSISVELSPQLAQPRVALEASGPELAATGSAR